MRRDSTKRITQDGLAAALPACLTMKAEVFLCAFMIVYHRATVLLEDKFGLYEAASQMLSSEELCEERYKDYITRFEASRIADRPQLPARIQQALTAYYQAASLQGHGFQAEIDCLRVQLERVGGKAALQEFDEALPAVLIALHSL